MRLNLFYFILALCWGKSFCIPQQLIDEVTSTMLPLFGFKDRPKIDSSKIQVPETLKKMYELQNNVEWDTSTLAVPGLYTDSANTVRSFIHVVSPIDDKFVKMNRFRLKFNVSSIPKSEKLKAAEIKLTRRIIEDAEEGAHRQRILAHDILQPGIKGVQGPIMRVIDSKLIDIRQNSTISLDVVPAVARWLENPSGNHGILITIHNTGKNKKASPKRHLRLKRDVTDENWEDDQPLLLAYTDDGTSKPKRGLELTQIRSKRATRRGHRKLQKDPCKRRQMFVNFRDVGWSDWIVAPLGYNAYYCDGECEYPMPDHLNTTNHAIVQALMSSVRPNDIPKPCCVPTQLSSMSMLYVDGEKNVILKNYKEMVVIGCGCR